MGSSCSTQIHRTKRKTTVPSESLALDLPLDPPFLFLSLPRELRDEIYIHILLSPTRYVFAVGQIRGGGERVNCFFFRTSPIPWNYWYYTGGFPPEKYVGLSLLLTCSQIHLEAMPHFYTQNTFICPTLTAPILKNTLAKHIRHLCVVAIMDSHYPSDVSAKSARMTRNLRLVARMPMLETLATGLVFERRLSAERQFEDMCTAKLSTTCAEMLKRDRAAYDRSVQSR